MPSFTLDEAIEDYNKALAIIPSYGEAYFFRGVAYTRKAAADFKKACDKGNKYACDNYKQLSE
ncbi:MAG: tetratricopeptide repeat protein [Thermodesulfovibrionales bacterium]|nr:tetratricopeptide repeat protein [Nitrospinota bacterium]MDP3048945.1 tetratricopeptide repeat protein [Thermodesulfovibrionales bacterium]